MSSRAVDILASTSFEIFAADALGGYRNFLRRVTKHPAYTAWSVLLMLVIFGAVVWLTSFILNAENDAIDFPMQLNDILFLFFPHFYHKNKFYRDFQNLKNPYLYFLIKYNLLNYYQGDY